MEGPILDILAKLADLADRLGAFALALAIVLAFTSGRVVLGSRIAEADQRVVDAEADAARERGEQAADFASQVAYLEARRKEERDDRIAAELAMRNLIDKLDSVTTLVQGLKEEVIRGGSSRRA